MLADHLIEPAGHVKAACEELEKSRDVRLVAVGRLDDERARILGEIDALEQRIANHTAAISTLHNQPGKVSLANRLRQILRLAPKPATLAEPSSDPLDLPPMPELQTIAEIVRLREDRGPTPREIAMRKRDVPS